MEEPILSVDHLCSPDTFVAGVPYELFSRLRHEEPVAWSADHTGGGFWSITRHADVVAVTRDVGTFSSAKGGTFLDVLPDEQLVQQRLLLVNTDPPAHARYRSLVAAAFAPKSVAKMEQAVRQRVESLVDQAVECGDVDFVTEVAARLPLEVICDLMGISSADHALMLAWSNRLMASDDPELNVTPADVVEAGAEAVGYFCGLAEERRRRAGGDLISTLATAEVGDERLSELEARAVLHLVVGRGKRDHPEHDRSRRPGTGRASRATSAPSGGSLAAVSRRRGTTSLQLGPVAVPPDRDPRHHDRCPAHRRGRPRRPLVSIGQPGRVRVRSARCLRRRPKPQPSPHLRRGRAAHLLGRPSRTTTAPDLVRRAVSKGSADRSRWPADPFAVQLPERDRASAPAPDPGVVGITATAGHLLDTDRGLPNWASPDARSDQGEGGYARWGG